MITKQCTYEDFGTWLNQDPNLAITNSLTMTAQRLYGTIWSN